MKNKSARKSEPNKNAKKPKPGLTDFVTKRFGRNLYEVFPKNGSKPKT